MLWESFVSNHQIVLFEICHLDKKGRSNEGCGDHLEYAGKQVGGGGGVSGEQKHSVIDLKHKHVATLLL